MTGDALPHEINQNSACLTTPEISLESLTGTQPHTIPNRFNRRHRCAGRIDLETVGCGLEWRTLARLGRHRTFGDRADLRTNDLSEHVWLDGKLFRRDAVSQLLSSAILLVRCHASTHGLVFIRFGFQGNGRSTAAANASSHLVPRVVSIQQKQDRCDRRDFSQRVAAD